MDIKRARQIADQQLKLSQEMVDVLADNTNVISTPDQFDRALSAAKPGDTILLDPILVYPAPLTITKSINLQISVPIPMARMTSDMKLPSFQGGIIWIKDKISLIGIEVKNSIPTSNIIEATGMSWVLSRCRVIGDPNLGAHRGLAAEPHGNCVVEQCYFDNCFQPSPGSDSQAIAMWNGKGLTIYDNYLSAGSETIILGGADSSSEDMMPSDVVINGNIITANPAWMGKAIGVKTRLELKACKSVTIEDNDIQYCWKQGQDGYLLTLNVRNQDGTAPWSCIQDVFIRDNRFAHGSAAISLLCSDYDNPSGIMENVDISDNSFTDLDPVKYPGTDRMIIWQAGGKPPITVGASKKITLNGNTFEMKNPSSQIYFDGPKDFNDGAVVTNNKWPKSTYGIFGTQPGPENAWDYFTINSTLSGNQEI